MAATVTFFKRQHTFLLIAQAYFILLAGCNLGFTVVYSNPGISEPIFLLLSLLPALFRSRTLYILFGTVLTFIFGYLMLAVTDDLIDFLRCEDIYTYPWKYFGFGYLFTSSGTLCSLAYLLHGEKPKNHVIEHSKAL